MQARIYTLGAFPLKMFWREFIFQKKKKKDHTTKHKLALTIAIIHVRHVRQRHRLWDLKC